MGHICPVVLMSKISVSWIEYKGAKNPPVLNVFIGVVKELTWLVCFLVDCVFSS